jgi:two-component system nitrogen regulation sensor histidine kinase NtrY
MGKLNAMKTKQDYTRLTAEKNSLLQLSMIIFLPCLIITTFALSLANVSFYLISFIIIVLLLLASFVVVTHKNRSEQQIRTLTNIVESMISGDYSLRGRLDNNQALQELLILVNNLADTLSQHKTEAKESRQLLEKIMAQMDAMVLAVDERGYVVMANDSAKKLLLGVEDNDDVDLQRISLASLELGQLITQTKSDIINFKQGDLHGEHLLIKEKFLSEGKQHQLYFITSAGRLLLEKERKSWQSLLRVLSHEMNNSLTPITSISQVMRKKLNDREHELNRRSLIEGVNIIHERATSLSTFIASYSQLSHLPLPNKSEFSLDELLINIAKLFTDCQLSFNAQQTIQKPFIINADKNQLEQVLINILKNAHESMADQQTKIIEVNYQQDAKYIHLSISDQGKGIANPANLFVPFYTTKTQGNGIGLTLSRQIIFNHGGLITLVNRVNANGAEAKISLPYLKQ